MNVLVCSIEEQLLGFDLEKIISIIAAVETTQLPQSHEYLLGAINIRGQIVPVVNTRKILGLPTKSLDPNDYFILCNINQKPMTLWVDNVHFIKNYQEEEFFSADELFPGSNGNEQVIRESNQIILIYDLDTFLPSLKNLNFHEN